MPTLRAILEAHDVPSAGGFGVRCDLRPSQAIALWQGKSPPSLRVIRAIHERLGVPWRELFSVDGVLPFTLADVLEAYDVPDHAALARCCGMTKTQAWNLWHGKTGMGIRVMRRIWEAMQIPLELLIMAERPKPGPIKRRGSTHVPVGTSVD